jgi:hypothetical protein
MTGDSNRHSFYINAPGVSSDEGCHWGDDSKPIGNWAPYVAGANTDTNGNTFVKLGINPVYQDSGLYNTKPTFGLEIECDGDCNGLPCKIDGNGVVSNEKATGAGGSDFCVVTVPSGGKANIVVYNLDGSGGDDDSDGGDDGDDDTSTSSSAEPTSTYPASTSTPEPTPTSTSTPTTTSVPSTSSAYPTSSSSSEAPKTTKSTTSSFTSASPVFSSSTSTPFFFGGVYHQNETSSSHSSSKGPTSTSLPPATATSGSASNSESDSASDSTSETGSESAPAPTESSKTENAGPRQDGAAVAGLVVAFVAAVYLL